jgi:hypothetical protein
MYFQDTNPAGAEVLDIVIVSNMPSNHSIRTYYSLPTSDHGLLVPNVR